ncbi:MAG: glycosyltransferase family 4 protein [Halioglobus sp.]
MKRLRVLLCPDTPKWSYDNICDQIVRYHSDKFEFERYYMAGSVGYPEVFLNQVFNIMDEFDIIHFFWREDVQHLLNPEIVFKAATLLRMPPEEFFSRIRRMVITASVYDHLLLEPEHFPWRERAFWFVDGYSVSSNTLDGIYSDISVFPDPIAVITDGVDTLQFSPINLERLSEPDRPLRIGWVGNSSWGNDPVRDAKGLKTILIPAIEQLQAEGHAITPHFADSMVRMRNRDEMTEYYSEIDILVCSSEIEGTPNPVLEAMASGLPVISTRVGIVPEVFGPLQSEFILTERSVDATAAALRRVLGNRSLLVELSNENLERIKDWTWEKTTRRWSDFWQAAVRRHQEGHRGPLKGYFLRERYAAWYSDHVTYKDAWRIASGPTRVRKGLKRRALDWIYRTPGRAALINRLRGR